MATRSGASGGGPPGGPGGGDGLADFPHLDSRGNAHMVDVTGKDVSDRKAVARLVVRMAPTSARRVADGDLPGGDVLALARGAGLLAAKQTARLLPLCHPLLLRETTVEIAVGEDQVEVTTTVEAEDRTGVEMEALTAASAAGLTIYAACASFDRTLSIDDLAVVEKSGGRSGRWHRDAHGAVHHDPAGHDPAGHDPAGHDPAGH
ncbi:MAG: cyclic pyranopterin monophosphate synthase MoaC [Acidimicrobiales bacterium]